LDVVDLRGAHDFRHAFATWLEDGAVPARVIDELDGPPGRPPGEREGSMIGTRYRHMTEAMQARVVAVIAERLAVALAIMPQVCPQARVRRGGGVLRREATRRVTCGVVVVELRGFEPLTPCMPLMRGWFTSPCTTSPTHVNRLFVMKRGAVPSEGDVGAARTAPEASHILRMSDICKTGGPRWVNTVVPQPPGCSALTALRSSPPRW